MEKITYTFPATCPIPELRGVTVHGGVLIRHGGKDAYRFATKVAGREVIATVAGKPELEAAAAAHRKAEAERAAEADKRDAEYALTPRGQRAALAKAERDSYSADAFPGSRQWLENKKHADALKAFDAAHPELVAELKAEREAAERAAYDRLSDFIKDGG